MTANSNYKLGESGYILNPETDEQEDIYSVSVIGSKLTIELPQIQKYIDALNEAREYKKKFEVLQAKFDKVRPTLEKHKTVFTAILNSLKGGSRGVGREDLFMRELIQDLETLLENKHE